MESRPEHLTRGEFIRLLIVRAIPMVLALVALWVGVSIYQVSRFLTNLLLLLALLVVLLAVFVYPAFKRRYGQPIWNRLPRQVQQIALGIKIVVLILTIVFLLLLGLSMPLILVLVCIQLLVENYNLRKQLEKKTL